MHTFDPEDLPPCHGLSHLFNSGRVNRDLLPDLLACCDRCHLTRLCAQTALHQERSASGVVTGIWGGVYVNAPGHGPGPTSDRRLTALARLEATANQPNSVMR